MTEHEETIDLNALRKSRGPFMSVITRSHRRSQKMLDEEAPATLDLDGLNDRLTSLETTELKGLRTHDSICDGETDEDQLEIDEEARENFRDKILSAKALIKRLIAMRKAHGIANNLSFNLGQPGNHQDTGAY